MKVALIIALFFIPLVNYANKIDRLTNKDEVEDFLISDIDSSLKSEEIFWDSTSFAIRFTDFGTNNFYKADIDNNGLTDLIVDGSIRLVILDKGQSKYKIYSLNNFFENHYQFNRKLLIANGRTALLYNVYSDNRRKENKEFLRTDTLIYKFGELIEYTADPKQHNVHQISLSTYPCFGSCPVFDLEIDEDGTAFYNPTAYTHTIGSFLGKVNKQQYHKLVEMLNYIRFTHLQDKYELPVTDLPTAVLKVTYDSNQVKVIDDYGEVGTRGLAALYAVINELRHQPHWTSWLESSISDSTLLSHASFFNIEGANGLRMTDFVRDSVNSTATEGIFVYAADSFFIKSDGTFIFRVNEVTEGVNSLSIGEWSLNKDTITLNWDGLETLKAVRDHAYDRFFSKKIPVRPLRLEDWKFIYLPEKLAFLHPY